MNMENYQHHLTYDCCSLVYIEGECNVCDAYMSARFAFINAPQSLYCTPIHPEFPDSSEVEQFNFHVVSRPSSMQSGPLYSYIQFGGDKKFREAIASVNKRWSLAYPSDQVSDKKMSDSIHSKIALNDSVFFDDGSVGPLRRFDDDVLAGNVSHVIFYYLSQAFPVTADWVQSSICPRAIPEHKITQNLPMGCTPRVPLSQPSLLWRVASYPIQHVALPCIQMALPWILPGFRETPTVKEIEEPEIDHSYGIFAYSCFYDRFIEHGAIQEDDPKVKAYLESQHIQPRTDLFYPSLPPQYPTELIHSLQDKAENTRSLLGRVVSFAFSPYKKAYSWICGATRNHETVLTSANGNPPTSAPLSQKTLNFQMEMAESCSEDTLYSSSASRSLDGSLASAGDCLYGDNAKAEQIALSPHLTENQALPTRSASHKEKLKTKLVYLIGEVLALLSVDQKNPFVESAGSDVQVASHGTLSDKNELKSDQFFPSVHITCEHSVSTASKSGSSIPEKTIVSSKPSFRSKLVYCAGEILALLSVDNQNPFVPNDKSLVTECSVEAGTEVTRIRQVDIVHNILTPADTLDIDFFDIDLNIDYELRVMSLTASWVNRLRFLSAWGSSRGASKLNLGSISHHDSGILDNVTTVTVSSISAVSNQLVINDVNETNCSNSVESEILKLANRDEHLNQGCLKRGILPSLKQIMKPVTSLTSDAVFLYAKICFIIVSSISRYLPSSESSVRLVVCNPDSDATPAILEAAERVRLSILSQPILANGNVLNRASIYQSLETPRKRLAVCNLGPSDTDNLA